MNSYARRLVVVDLDFAIQNGSTGLESDCFWKRPFARSWLAIRGVHVEQTVCKTGLRLGNILELGKIYVGLLKDLVKSVLLLHHETWQQHKIS